jgi:hypothetical protein
MPWPLLLSVHIVCTDAVRILPEIPPETGNMNETEYLEAIGSANDLIAGIVHAQEVLANIKEELRRNLSNPFEQDWIYREQSGDFPAAPKIIQWQGVEIQTRILHQTGINLSDIHGADLLYEIEGEKYVIVQFKRENSGRIQNDAAQLRKLLENCPGVCRYHRNPPMFIPPRMEGFCGVWHRINTSNEEQKYLHACEIKEIFGDRGSAGVEEFRSGIQHETFMDLFASCRIGALVRNPSEQFVSMLLFYKHVVFEAKQRGRWA